MTTLTRELVAGRLAGAQGWEAKNRLLVQLARELPRLPEPERSDESLVAGCESRAWLRLDWPAGRLALQADSDSRVVQGLLALVCACYQGLDARQVVALDFEGWLGELGLARFLSASRRNGLRAIVARIRKSATTRLEQDSTAQ